MDLPRRNCTQGVTATKQTRVLCLWTGSLPILHKAYTAVGFCFSFLPKNESMSISGSLENIIRSCEISFSIKRDLGAAYCSGC